MPRVRNADAAAIHAGTLVCLCLGAILFFIAHHSATQTDEGAIHSSANPVATPSSAASLVITRGGVYQGSWHSDDPNIPAVLVKTTDPVIIENSEIRGLGDLIRTGVDHVNLVVRNCRAAGLNPNVLGRPPGRFFSGEICDCVTIENNDIIHTGGIYLLSYGGDFREPHTFKILRNRVRDIDGRKSDGRNGWLAFNVRVPRAGGVSESGFVEAQFVALDKVRHVPGIEIAWNEVINHPGDSRVEDNINVYLSSGTPGSPIRIHDNFVRGAYTIDPARANDRDDRYEYDWSYSGGGILLGDGNPDSPENAPALVQAYDNQVLDTSNYGIAIEVGHDSSFYRNRILSAGQLSDGRPIHAQNVGAGIWDGHHGARRNPPTFFNNAGHDNLVGWRTAQGRNDWWTPDAQAWTGNQHWAAPITADAEKQEWAFWNKKLADAKVSVGAGE